jgi:hypothetical protein
MISQEPDQQTTQRHRQRPHLCGARGLSGLLLLLRVNAGSVVEVDSVLIESLDWSPRGKDDQGALKDDVEAYVTRSAVK